MPRSAAIKRLMDTDSPAAVTAGARFGRYSVVAWVPPSSGKRGAWLCRCDCGAERVVLPGNLLTGNTKSCGCLRREQPTKHGAYRTPEYRAWRHIIERCTVETHPSWGHYGGRGIGVAAEWRSDFAAFLAHIGPRPSDGHEVDRIDNDRGYEPGNVRWATRSEQMRNTRANHRIEVLGESITIIEASERFGINEGALRHRIARGWPVERALTEASHAAS